MEIVFRIKHIFFTDSEVSLLVSSKMYSYITLTKLLPMLNSRALTLLTVPNKEPENDCCARAKYHHILMTFKRLSIRENNVKSASAKTFSYKNSSINRNKSYRLID